MISMFFGSICLAVFIFFIMVKASQLAAFAGGNDVVASQSDRLIMDIILAISGTGAYLLL